MKESICGDFGHKCGLPSWLYFCGKFNTFSTNRLQAFVKILFFYFFVYLVTNPMDRLLLNEYTFLNLSISMALQ